MSEHSMFPAWVALVLCAACAHATRASAPRHAATRRGSDSANVGYGMQTRETVLGPVSSLRLERDPAWTRGTRIEALLEGRVAGVEVQRLPNGDLTVRVRGAESGSGDPLWVVDGVPMRYGVSARELLRDINPGDVARIDVLKGSAASVYGARGSNGVILITLRGVRPREE